MTQGTGTGRVQEGLPLCLWRFRALKQKHKWLFKYEANIANSKMATFLKPEYGASECYSDLCVSLYVWSFLLHVRFCNRFAGGWWVREAATPVISNSRMRILGEAPYLGLLTGKKWNNYKSSRKQFPRGGAADFKLMSLLFPPPPAIFSTKEEAPKGHKRSLMKSGHRFYI